MDDYPLEADDFPVSDEVMARHNAFRKADKKVAVLAVAFLGVFQLLSLFELVEMTQVEIVLLAALVFASGKILQLEKRLVWLEEKAFSADRILWRHHGVLRRSPEQGKGFPSGEEN